MTKKLIVVVLTLMLVAPCASTSATAENYTAIYPKLVLIFDITSEDNVAVIHCVDREDNEWIFTDDINEWQVGDIAVLLILGHNAFIEEHQIIDVVWEGFLEDIDIFFQIKGWQ